MKSLIQGFSRPILAFSAMLVATGCGDGSITWNELGQVITEGSGGIRIEFHSSKAAPDGTIYLYRSAGHTSTSTVDLKVKIVDSNGDLETGYTGTVTLSATGPSALPGVPLNYAFAPQDGGQKAFFLTIPYNAEGTWEVVVAEDPSGASSSVTIKVVTL